MFAFLSTCDAGWSNKKLIAFIFVLRHCVGRSHLVLLFVVRYFYVTTVTYLHLFFGSPVALKSSVSLH